MIEPMDRALLVLVPAVWVMATIAWAWRVAKLAGSPVVLPSPSRLERAFPWIWTAWMAAPLLAAGTSDICVSGCLWEPGSGAPRIAALALEGGGFVLAASASLTLGPSWRIGIGDASGGRLVTNGMYRWIRNPLFGGMLLALLGFVVYVPALPFVALWGASFLLLRAQAIREEAALSARFGAAYVVYLRETGRWLPYLGAQREREGS